ncbi:MAG: T9SS C-terminal target domain-containing protein [Bacteroidetes bacterium]|nr:MAG: T9SS C-terminal target domain-containing protein [Bacteroidota bacterium]
MKAFLRFLPQALLISILGISSVFAQDYYPEPYKPGSEERRSSVIELKTQEDIIWYEDFDGGLPLDWENVDLSGYCSFTHTYDGPQGPFSVGMPPLNSQTAHNGFMILDSDLCSSQDPEGFFTDAYIQSPSIDLSGFEKVQLRFQHNFRYCCSASQVSIVAEVSTDGENWTSWDVRNGLAPNNTSPNPVNQAINISSVAAGHEQVWIRFRKTGATHYWWMIDDVMLVSFVENDLKITDTYYNHGYIKVPDGQQQPFQFAADVINAGGFVQNKIVLSASVNQLLFDAATDTLNALTPAQQIQMVIPPFFTPPGRGTYTAEFNLTQKQQDDVPSDNTATVTFHVTDSVYSRTVNAYYSDVYLMAEEGENLVAGNLYHIYSEMEATSVSLVLHENTLPGAELGIAIFEFTGENYTKVHQNTELYTVSAGDITPADADSPVYVTIGLEGEVLFGPGEYLVVVTAEANQNIVIAAQDVVKQPEGASWRFVQDEWFETIYTPMVNLNFGNNNVECNTLYDFVVENAVCGTASGSIQIVPLTGQEPYDFIWDDEPGMNTDFRDNLMAGDYVITVTDGFGCETELNITVGDVDITLEYEVTDAICATGGSVIIIPVNGQEPFTYEWSHDPEFNAAQAEDLQPGSYTIIVTDANGCEAVIDVEVEDFDEMPVNVMTQSAMCGADNGSIELVPLAGVEPFTFEWHDFSNAHGSVLDDLVPGEYNFSVVDANGCGFTGTAVIEDISYELEIGYDVWDATCGFNNGEIQVEVLNGQAPFAFYWSNSLQEPGIVNLAPDTYHLTIYDEFGCETQQSFTINNIGDMPLVNWELENSAECGQSNGSISIYPNDPEAQYTFTLLDDKGNILKDDGNGQTPAFLAEGLAAGQYIIIVTSEDGCEKTLTLEISDAGAPEILAQVSGITCHGDDDGSISVTLVGAQDPEYLWNDPEGSTVPDLDNLPPGLYTLQVTDDGCKAIASFEIIEPAPLLANANINHIVCANDQLGSIFLEIYGGTNPYTFIWNNGVSNKNLVDVQAGDYSIFITDFHNCTFTNNYTINTNEPLVVEADVTYSDPGETNGSIVVSVTGGTGGYSYLWNNGMQTPVLTGLAPGTYELTVTDNAGCVVEKTYHIGTVNVPDIMPEAGIRVFPNPAETNLNISITGICLNHIVEAEIINIVGEKVFGRSYSDLASNDEISIDVRHMPPGIYILRIKCNRQVWQSKFIKK